MIGLLERKRGCPTQGVLSRFSPEVQQASREHKRWGAIRVLVELQNDPVLTGLAFPSRSRLYAFFHQACPDCLSLWTKHKEVPASSADSRHQKNCAYIFLASRKAGSPAMQKNSPGDPQGAAGRFLMDYRRVSPLTD